MTHGDKAEESAVVPPSSSLAETNKETSTTTTGINGESNSMTGLQSSDDYGRTVIQVDDIDFVTMHNLLYFLYTGRANLYFGTVADQALTGFPDEADAFDLYRAADFYGVQPLADRCFQFLKGTRTPDNICERLFSIMCKPYEKLQKEYINYILENYGKIKGREDWKATFFDDSQTLTVEEQRYRAEILVNITNRLVFPRSA